MDLGQLLKVHENIPLCKPMIACSGIVANTQGPRAVLCVQTHDHNHLIWLLVAHEK